MSTRHHKTDGISLSKMKEKKYKIVFCFETAANTFYRRTLKEVRELIHWFCSGGTTLDLDSVVVFRDDEIIKHYDGNRLFSKYIGI